MLPSLTVAFISGLVLGSLVPYFPISVSCLVVLVAVGIASFERIGRSPTSFGHVLFACLLIGMLYWSAAVERITYDFQPSYDSENVQEISGRIAEPVQHAPDRFTMLVVPDSDGAEPGWPRRIRLTWRAPERMLFEGDRIRFKSKLRVPTGSLNPGGFDYATYLERQGIDAVATVSGPEAIEKIEDGQASVRWMVWNQFDRWRGNIRLASIHSLLQPALGIYLGIILGDRGYIDADLRDEFMITGTVHLLSISGSHLGLVAVLTFMVVRRVVLHLPAIWLLKLSRTVTPTRIAALVTIVPVTVYACLAGAELATMRSLLMVLVALLARWLGYGPRIFHALALAAVIILVHDPQAIYDISFQLSFLSVCAIAAWLERSSVPQEAERTKPTPIETGIRWGREALVTSAVVTLATLPLVALYFNQFPWLGLLTNLVAVPFMGLVLVPMGLSAAVWHLFANGSDLPLSSSLQALIEFFVKGLALFSRIPASEWHVASPSIPLVLVFYGCLALLWLTRGSVLIRWLSAIAVALIIFWWGWSPRLAVDGDRFRIMFLDVAQGDSTVLELPGGKVVLIDGGATYERFDMGRGVVAPYLWNRGIKSIDHVIATHPQLDHVGGLTWVIKHFSVKNFWGNGDARDEMFYRRLKEALDQRGLSEQIVQAGDELRVSDGCRLGIENPPALTSQNQSLNHGRRKEGQGLNNRSVVTRLTCGRHSVLFSADIEQAALLRLREQHEQPVSGLKVPHHGAVSSLDREWIASLHPRYAVVSVGRHNPYGHPASPVLAAYAERGISLFRTDRDGGVWIVADQPKDNFEVQTTRALSLQRTHIDIWMLGHSEKDNWYRLWRQWRERM